MKITYFSVHVMELVPLKRYPILHHRSNPTNNSNSVRHRPSNETFFQDALSYRHFKSAAALLIIFTMSSWFTTGYIAYSNSHIPNSDDPMALFDKIYDKPWTRLGPYFIGMVSGWILYKTDCNIRMAKVNSNSNVVVIILFYVCFRFCSLLYLSVGRLPSLVFFR